MATFKNAIVAAVGTTAANVYTTPTANTSIVIGLDISNVSAADITANVIIRDHSASTNAFLVRNALIPVGTNLNVVSGQKIVLEAGDFIQVQSTAASSLNAVGSILEGV